MYMGNACHVYMYVYMYVYQYLGISLSNALTLTMRTLLSCCFMFVKQLILMGQGSKCSAVGSCSCSCCAICHIFCAIKCSSEPRG